MLPCLPEQRVRCQTPPSAASAAAWPGELCREDGRPARPGIGKQHYVHYTPDHYLDSPKAKQLLRTDSSRFDLPQGPGSDGYLFCIELAAAAAVAAAAAAATLIV